MTIELYLNTSDPNVVKKNITLQATATGTLRDSSSVLTPKITIESASFPSATYARIPEFNRYYYITDISSVRNGLWLLTMEVDVLMSYKEYFLNLSAIIARQENVYNLYLDDDKFLVNSQRMYVTKAFPNRVQSGNVDGASSFILTLAGGESSTTTE